MAPIKRVALSDPKGFQLWFWFRARIHVRLVEVVFLVVDCIHIDTFISGDLARFEP